MTTSDADVEARLVQLGRFFMGTSNVHLALAKLVRKLEELQIPYAVCGAMALNAHGYHRATTDVDVVLTAAGLAKFKQQAIGLGWLDRFAGSRGVNDTEFRVKIDFLITGGIPGNGTPCGVTFPDPTDVAVEINGAKYVGLARLIEMKLASGLSSPDRLKDHADVIELIRVHGLGEFFADPLHPYVGAKFRELWRHAQLPTGEY